MRLTTLPFFLLLRLTASQDSSPSPSLEPSEFTNDLPTTALPHLDLRANPPVQPAPVQPAPVAPGGAGAAPTQPPAATPMPTVSTVMVDTVIGGTRTQVPVVFTQTFVKIPSQGPLPQVGTIGLGTLTKAGAAKTGKVKRDRGAGRSGWLNVW